MFSSEQTQIYNYWKHVFLDFRINLLIVNHRLFKDILCNVTIYYQLTTTSSVYFPRGDHGWVLRPQRPEVPYEPGRDPGIGGVAGVLPTRDGLGEQGAALETCDT